VTAKVVYGSGALLALVWVLSISGVKFVIVISSIPAVRRTVIRIANFLLLLFLLSLFCTLDPELYVSDFVRSFGWSVSKRYISEMPLGIGSGDTISAGERVVESQMLSYELLLLRS
jgi:hypothetical protein